MVFSNDFLHFLKIKKNFLEFTYKLSVYALKLLRPYNFFLRDMFWSGNILILGQKFFNNSKSQ